MKKFLRIGALLILDILIICLSVLIALALHADLSFQTMGMSYLSDFLVNLPVLAACAVIALTVCGNSVVLWQFASARDMMRLTFSAVFSCGACWLIETYVLKRSLPLAAYVGGAAIAILLMLASRIILRHMLSRRSLKRKLLNENFEARFSGNVMIIGAGNAASLLLHDIKNNYATHLCKVVCVIDDDPQKLGSYIYGVKVVGNRDTIAQNAKNFHVKTIICAIPSMSKSEKSELYNICTATGCEVRTLPDINQILDGKVGVRSVRRVQIEDLLGRDPIHVDLNRIMAYVENKTILVTGGGGSIGSELCRQIAAHNPKKLIIFDIYENNAYDILNELKRRYPALDVTALIGSVRDKNRLNSVFEQYRPEIVYHAAAHKHVPLMEDSPNEAIKNNVFGTLNTVKAADKYGVKRFVLISTDKAVNPTNIMGASKRLCEMIVQTFDKHSDTEFVAVRFGNVLGSNGSVIPLFKRQIAEGGPVTVTHKDMIRYFMTIPEAVSLVLLAGSFAKGGEIFVLDMGKPVRILALAENLIRLSGYKPYEDIEIRFTGLRPGEKLYEEVLMNEEGLQTTENQMIRIGKPIELDENAFLAGLQKLHDSMADDRADIRSLVRELVPTYHDPQTDLEKKHIEETVALHPVEA
ncbi:MAG: polysaccharide biosynthesis protein [Ruminococcaceae bacterium]|nr:polysaccharide biosynthesis protein [Oscillospiraceae bacterium]